LKLRSKRTLRIGKGVDRLEQDEGASLTPDRPVEYECDELAVDIDYLATFPQRATALALGLSERGWRNVIKRVSQPFKKTAERIGQIAAVHRVKGS
jgi:hypothetical protein